MAQPAHDRVNAIRLPLQGDELIVYVFLLHCCFIFLAFSATMKLLDLPVFYEAMATWGGGASLPRLVDLS